MRPVCAYKFANMTFGQRRVLGRMQWSIAASSFFRPPSLTIGRRSLAALEHALALVAADDTPSSWLLHRRNLQWGPISAVRSACASAAARGGDIAQFSSELETRRLEPKIS